MTLVIDTSAVGAIADFGDLCSEIAEWLDRDDLEPRIPSFIALAEAEIQRRLGVVEFEKSVTQEATNGVLSMPIDLKSITTIVYDGCVLPHRGRTVDQVTGGTPISYTVIGGAIRLNPASTATVTLDYQARFVPLTEASQSNVILTRYPDVYLFGALAMAEAYLANDERVGGFVAQFDNGLIGAAKEIMNMRHGGGPLVTQNPVRQVGGVRA